MKGFSTISDINRCKSDIYIYGLIFFIFLDDSSVRAGVNRWEGGRELVEQNWEVLLCAEKRKDWIFRALWLLMSTLLGGGRR